MQKSIQELEDGIKSLEARNVRLQEIINALRAKFGDYAVNEVISNLHRSFWPFTKEETERIRSSTSNKVEDQPDWENCGGLKLQ